jgi:hypothetical protein
VYKNLKKGFLTKMISENHSAKSNKKESFLWFPTHGSIPTGLKRYSIKPKRFLIFVQSLCLIYATSNSSAEKVLFAMSVKELFLVQQLAE